MEKYITGEHSGLKYELVGDYYLIAGDDEPEQKPLGIWGQRHRQFLRENRNAFYTGQLLSGRLDNYLLTLNHEAEEMFSTLIRELAAKQGISEKLKSSDQMAWVRAMNAIYAAAREIVNADLIYV